MIRIIAEGVGAFIVLSAAFYLALFAVLLVWG